MPDISGMMGVMMAMFLIVPVLIVAVIGALIIWALRDRRTGGETAETPLTILQRRYARGDISTEEYERIRATLAKS